MSIAGLIATVIATSSLAATTVLAAGSAANTPTPTSKAAAASAHGTVTEVREVQVKGQGSGVGVVAGAVVGGLLGNQVGKGSGNTLATVGGAVAGGYAGNEVEKHAKRHSVFRTKVKLDDGKVREFSLSQRYAVGARVDVDGKKVTLAP